MTTFKLEVTPDNAAKMRDWLANRGGIAVWRSVNLSNPGGQWLTPADVKEKPTWQASGTPEIVTDQNEVGVVYSEVLYKAFRVGLRAYGMGSKLTDGAQRRLDKVMNQCREKHGSAHYRKGVLDIEGASMGVYYTDSVVAL